MNIEYNRLWHSAVHVGKKIICNSKYIVSNFFFFWNPMFSQSLFQCVPQSIHLQLNTTTHPHLCINSIYRRKSIGVSTLPALLIRLCMSTTLILLGFFSFSFLFNVFVQTGGLSRKRYFTMPHTKLPWVEVYRIFCVVYSRRVRRVGRNSTGIKSQLEEYWC